MRWDLSQPNSFRGMIAVASIWLQTGCAAKVLSCGEADARKRHSVWVGLGREGADQRMTRSRDRAKRGGVGKGLKKVIVEQWGRARLL
jgi:hypothetical protein